MIREVWGVCLPTGDVLSLPSGKSIAMGDIHERIRVLRVDDHPRIREGSAALISAQTILSRLSANDRTHAVAIGVRRGPIRL